MCECVCDAVQGPERELQSRFVYRAFGPRNASLPTAPIRRTEGKQQGITRYTQPVLVLGDRSFKTYLAL